jgi:hypothetical protein
MSHFAKVEDGKVITVIVAEQDHIDTLEGQWIQTSYNTRGGVHCGQDGKPDGGVALRYNYASTGGFYDAEHDAFYGRQPYPNWVVNQTTWLWEPPVPYPTDGKLYIWDQPTTTWLEAK